VNLPTSSFGGNVLPELWQRSTSYELALNAIALALGVLGGIYPAFWATHINPIDAIRYE
jgi:ABC-type antimicrobial peptide transport system permease subunit